MASHTSPPRIFISYARSDGEAFARTLRSKLTTQGFALWQDRTDMEGGKGWWDQIVEALKVVEYLVLVMTPAALQSDVVRKEWRLARENGVCVIPISGVPDLDFSSLPNWMRATHFVNIDVPEQWTRLIRTLESPCQSPQVPFMAPALPVNFVPRPTEFEQLAQAILNPENEEPVAITAALRGAGGYGKTTLAMALCHDLRIREAYYDGILWVTIGQRPGDLTTQVLDLIETLSGTRPGFVTCEAATAHLSQLLQDRVLLLVVDDIWDAAHLKPFVQGGPRCTRLITTRDSSTLPPGTTGLPVDAMRDHEAVGLLVRGLPAHAPEQKRLSQLASRLGYWPLLLTLVHAALQEHMKLGEPLAEALGTVEQALDQEGLQAFDAQNASARDHAVAKTIALSLDLLHPEERARYFELAIFPEDTDIPLAIVTKLWESTGNYDFYKTKKLCVRLQRLSLLLSLDMATQRLWLHDVMRTYLQEQTRSQLSARHAQFLDACTPSRWGDLDPHHHYLYSYAPYHLHHAGRHRELKSLLLSFEWLEAKLRHTDVTALVNDYAWSPEDPALQEVHGALRLSAHVLAKNTGQLASQLVGRLLTSSHHDVTHLLEQAQKWKGSPWLRPLSASLIKPGGPLTRTLTGHTKGVEALALTPDGRHVVSASGDSTLKVWDLATGQALHTLAGHTEWVTALALTPDGCHVVSASGDCTLKVWDLATGQALHTMTGHIKGVKALALTPDERHVISASDDSTLEVWDLATGQALHTLAGHTKGVEALALTPDGRHVVSASGDCTLKIWDLATGQALHTLAGHTNRVTSLTLTPDGRHVVSASGDCTLKVWDLATGQALHTLAGHTGWVTALALTPDGRHVVSASGDSTLKIWDLATGQALHTLAGHIGGVTALALTPDGRHVVSASDDSTLKIWDLATGQALHTLAGHIGGVTALALTPDGRHVVSASDDSTLKVWDLATGQALHTLAGHTGWVTALALTPDGRHVVSASGDCTLKIWDLATGQALHTLAGHTGWVTALALTPDGRHVVSASGDCTLKIWDLATGQALHTLAGHTNVVRALALTPDGRHVVSASGDCTLKIWDLATGQALHTLAGHTGWVTALALTPDERHVISASHDSTLKIWDLATGQALHTLAEHTGGVLALACTPDGRHVVSASHDSTLKIWDLATGQALHTLAGHTGWVTALALTPDGRHVVSASGDSTLKIWDLATGQALHTLAGHTNRVTSLALTPDGRHVVSASGDCTLTVWDLGNGKTIAIFQCEAPVLCLCVSNRMVVVIGDQGGSVHFLHLEGQPVSVS